VIAIQRIKCIVTDSPMVCLSLGTCIWSYSRALIIQLTIDANRPFPLDLPLLANSPAMNMAMTLTVVTLIGVVASVMALVREKEDGWYLGLVTLVLNVSVWWYSMSVIEWERSSFWDS